MRDSKGRFIKGNVPYHKGRNTVKCICRLCKKIFYPSDFAKRVFCSKECLFRSNYKKGRKMPIGKYANNWKYGCQEYYRKQARIKLNRDNIHDDFVIHHKDRNVTNNDLSNLQVLSRSEHTKLHNNLGHLRGGAFI